MAEEKKELIKKAVHCGIRWNISLQEKKVTGKIFVM